MRVDRFMPEINLRQSGITYSDRVPFPKHKERIPIFKEKKRDSEYIHQNKLHRNCFQHEIAYGDFKELPIRTAAEKVLGEKFIATNLKYDRY